ncbi:predicted protein [Naegleria gruberi]|uniref:non-specific serine/threonine protein kinase n=1 Tax=Naegleria gruberi TaxID=5762 RepID=D2VU80_NAEGR|nr:uncharacterized protein NAEGRDRAFT_72567 [Naegleria gruberi]EFC39642.1 predicted protein [Naegleria gruberi]|eukprot:XP_002672386.1 predicted protein [Naegleria gruberi strain NEG-M]
MIMNGYPTSPNRNFIQPSSSSSGGGASSISPPNSSSPKVGGGRQRRKAILVSPSSSPSMNGRNSADSNTSSPASSPNTRIMMGSPLIGNNQMMNGGQTLPPFMMNNNFVFHPNSNQQQPNQNGFPQTNTTSSSPPLFLNHQQHNNTRNVNTNQQQAYFPSQFHNHHNYPQVPLTFTPSPLYVQSPSNSYVPSPSNSYSTTGTIRSNLANTKLVDSFVIEEDDEDDDEFMSSKNSQPISVISPAFSVTPAYSSVPKKPNPNDALESFDLIDDDDDERYDIDQNFGSFNINTIHSPIQQPVQNTTPNFMITPITQDEFDEMDIDFGSSPFKSNAFLHASKPSTTSNPQQQVNHDFNSDVLFVSDEGSGKSEPQDGRRSTADNDDEYDLMGLSEIETKPSETSKTHSSKKSHSSSNFQKNFRYYCILMEYCSGKILDQFISDLNEITKESKGLKTLTMDVRFSWFIKLLEVMNYLHQNKVIHRDLKPQNIIVQYDSDNLKNNFEEEIRKITLKIIDFGLAKQLVHQNSTSTICGTRAYVAPEVKPGAEYDYKVDVYSLGIIFMQVSATLTVKDFQQLIDQRARRYNIDFWLFMRSNHYFEFIHEHVFDIGSKRIVKMMVCAREERKSAAELLEHPVIQTWRFIFENDSSQLLNILSKPESLLGFLSGLDTSSLFVKKSILGMKDLLSNEKLRQKCCELMSEYRVLPVLMFYISRKLFSDRAHTESSVELNEMYDEIFKSTLSIISQVLTYYDNQTDKRHIKRIIREMRNETSSLLVDELGRYSTTCILNFIHAKVFHSPEFFFTLSCLKIIFFLCKYDKSTRVGYCLWLERNQSKIGRSSDPLSEKKTQLLRGIYTYISLIEPGYATLLSPNYNIEPILVEVFNEIPFHHRRAIIKPVWQKLAKILNLALDTGDESAADRVLGVMNNFLYDFFSLEKFTTYHTIGNTKFGAIVGDNNVCGLPNSMYYLIPTGSGLLTFGLLKNYSYVDRQTLIYHLLCNNLNPNDIKVFHFDNHPNSTLGNEKELINHYLGNYSPVPIETKADFSHLVNLQGSPLKVLDNERTLHFVSSRATKMSLTTKDSLFFFQPEIAETRRFGNPSANIRKPSMKTVFYYEVQIHRLISSKVSIGLMARSNISENNCVDRKYAFQAQEGFGCIMSADKKEILYKELEIIAHCGDTIGCGLTEQGEVYFTMNGIFLFSISLHQRIMHSSIFPFIEVLSTPNDECLLHLNLGENLTIEPFIFDHQPQLNPPNVHFSEVNSILRSLNLNQLQPLPNFKGLRKFIELQQKR